MITGTEGRVAGPYAIPFRTGDENFYGPADPNIETVQIVKASDDAKVDTSNSDATTPSTGPAMNPAVQEATRGDLGTDRRGSLFDRLLYRKPYENDKYQGTAPRPTYQVGVPSAAKLEGVSVYQPRTHGQYTTDQAASNPNAYYDHGMLQELLAVVKGQGG